MAKVMIIGDMHMGVKNSDPVVLAYQTKWLEKAFKYAADNGIESVIQAGDMLDVRKFTNNLLIHHLRAIICPMIADLNDNFGIGFYKIRGNHECYYRESNTVGADDLIADFAPAFVVQENRTVECSDGTKILLVSWINKSNTEPQLYAIEQSDAQYCVGHFELTGFPMYRGVLATHGMETGFLFKFKRVLSGHYHTVSEHQNITYVGSPYPLTWQDYVDRGERGFFILDTQTNVLEFIKNDPDDCLFTEIEYDQEVKYSDESLTGLKGKYVRIIVNKKDDTRHYNRFKSLMSMCGALDYQTIDNTILMNVSEQDVKVDEFKTDTMDAFRDYVERVDNDSLDKNAIIGLGLKIYERVMLK